jgi:hypothetical protein
MHRTDIFSVILKMSLNSKRGGITDLVKIDGKWLVIFAWQENEEEGFMIPKTWVECEDSELEALYGDPHGADYRCKTPMDPQDIFRLPSIGSAVEQAQRDLSPEWLFELPTA